MLVLTSEAQITFYQSAESINWDIFLSFFLSFFCVDQPNGINAIDKANALVLGYYPIT